VAAYVVYPEVTYTVQATASCNDPWIYWNTGGNWIISSGQCSVASVTWTVWNDVYTTNVSANAIISGQPFVVNQRTPEEIQVAIAEQERLRIQAEAAAAADRKRSVQAVGRARALLDSVLSAAQRKTLQELKFFDLEVLARDGAKKVYRIRQGRSGNVDLLGPDGKPIRRYCAHPSLYVPDEDTMLAQKLMLETAEEQFLATANCHVVAA
jgi:hypothetical protein